ncbi:unnamed protein product (mitochondrion) [Plasmodiophora brassicae]|uniref:Uncharacterized protein n=1 Tax=Plasmodiophora brassicae TaxID=37360 RepID=A0A3P3Y075_PLABS|nr:unnamed protein product [Plasmodiophora brassicae]
MLDWKSFAESIYSVVGRTILGERGVKFNISECQWISLGTTDGVYHPGELYFKYTLDAATPWRKVKIFKTNSVRPAAPLPLYTQPRVVDSVKQDSLHTLSQYVPEQFRHLPMYKAADVVALQASQAAVMAKRAARSNRDGLSSRRRD